MLKNIFRVEGKMKVEVTTTFSTWCYTLMRLALGNELKCGDPFDPKVGILQNLVRVPFFLLVSFRSCRLGATTMCVYCVKYVQTIDKRRRMA